MFIYFKYFIFLKLHSKIFFFNIKDTPVADAKFDDIKDLLGGALFLPLFKWMKEVGPVYLLPTGPISSFLVVSDP